MYVRSVQSYGHVVAVCQNCGKWSISWHILTKEFPMPIWCVVAMQDTYEWIAFHIPSPWLGEIICDLHKFSKSWGHYQVSKDIPEVHVLQVASWFVTPLHFSCRRNSHSQSQGQQLAELRSTRSSVCFRVSSCPSELLHGNGKWRNKFYMPK